MGRKTPLTRPTHTHILAYNPQTAASVLAHSSIDAPAHVTAETKLPRHQARQVSIFSSYVEHRGLEPLTYCLQSSRATNCANAPWTSIV